MICADPSIVVVPADLEDWMAPGWLSARVNYQIVEEWTNWVAYGLRPDIIPDEPGCVTALR